jgi:S1-C subfamily serine protease
MYALNYFTGLANGEIASLSGAADDPRYFQISVPVQPGNSGGALVDERGNVIGIVCRPSRMRRRRWRQRNDRRRAADGS